MWQEKPGKGPSPSQRPEKDSGAALGSREQDSGITDSKYVSNQKGLSRIIFNSKSLN